MARLHRLPREENGVGGGSVAVFVAACFAAHRKLRLEKPEFRISALSKTEWALLKYAVLWRSHFSLTPHLSPCFAKRAALLRVPPPLSFEERGGGTRSKAATLCEAGGRGEVLG